MNTGLRFLRPYLSKSLSPIQKSVYIHFFHSTRCLAQPPKHRKLVKEVAPDLKSYTEFTAAEVRQRVEELEEANALAYPRIQRTERAVSCLDFLKKYELLKAGERRDECYVIRGRLRTARIAGKNLAFLDIVQNGHTLQAVCNFAKFAASGGAGGLSFQQFYHLVRRGDIISVYGHPYCSESGQVSIRAVEIPTILSPSLASLPLKLEDPATRIRNRHVDLLINPKVASTIRARSHIIQHIRNFLLKDNFLEVQTPIIADKAGGAVARPFTTVSTEFSDKQLALRIAPEIWLKRLILGGMERVFEIGPAFRNEGLDATHNPEFTTCEFYKSFADLEDLIEMTENLVSGLADRVKELRAFPLKALPEPDASLSGTPFRRLQFIPTIEAALGEKLPDLSADDATERVLELFAKHNIIQPSSATLPRLLDKLSSIYIESYCNEPTFITYHPSCMAPLSKSFIDPATKQEVSARAELFIHHNEIANMYEEENSPFEQRKKFIQQVKWKDNEYTASIDESYLEALQWGLPPTGGWGCGIDRLCMLFSGVTRISDVLSFGSLRNVVNLGRGSIPEDKAKKDENP